MKYPRSLGLAAAVLLAGLLWWLVSNPREHNAADAGSSPAASPGFPKTGLLDTTAKAPTGMAAVKKNVEIAATASAPAPDWRKMLQDSDDYWAFAESAIGPAKRGDGEARYWLALALNECVYVYQIYFFETLPDKPPRLRTIDEARQSVTQPSLYKADDMDLLDKRCSRLSQARNAPFGNGYDWMVAALAVDNPLAQANAATEKAISSTYIHDPEDAREARSEARRLILDALRTRDPEVLLLVSGAAANLAPGDEVEGKRRHLSWTLAACLRTPDCESLGLWRKYRCNWDSQCQPYETPLDIIRRDAGSDFDEVERRARELNEKIDAGTLDESDI
jgi:hypothetical protein